MCSNVLTRRLFIWAGLFLAIVAVLSLPGCVFSSTITNVIYEQDESLEIDPNAPKIYINSPDGDFKSDQLPSLTPIDEGQRDRIEGLPTFEGDLTNEEIREASLGEASEKNSDTPSDSSSSQWEAGEGTQHDESVENTDEKSEGAGEAQTQNDPASQSESLQSNPTSQGTASQQGQFNDSNATGNGAGEGGSGNEGQSPEGGGRDDDEQNAGDNGDDPNAGSNVGRLPGMVFADIGSLDDLPDGVKSVAAVDNAAIAVLCVGAADGTSNLVATNANLLSSRSADVLTACGIQFAQQAWSGSGVHANDINIDKLIEIAPDAVLVSEGSDMLTASARQRLLDAGIHVIYVPAMLSPTRTKQCVERIATLLAKGGDDKALDRSRAYSNFVDTIIKDCQSPTGLLFTLYISRWVSIKSSAYSDPYGHHAMFNGVAFAPGGSATAINSYLEVAGIQNVASVKTRYAYLDGEGIVWPFSGGTNDKDWQGLTGVNAGLSTTSNGYDLSLTRYEQSSAHTYHDLGSVAYPAVITRTPQIAEAILADRSAGGLYAAGYNDTSIISNEYGVYVNPQGLVGNWAQGSMESILESAWADAQFRTGDATYFFNKLQEFYAQFYGYGLSGDQMNAIVSGTYAD